MSAGTSYFIIISFISTVKLVEQMNVSTAVRFTSGGISKYCSRPYDELQTVNAEACEMSGRLSSSLRGM